MQRVMGVSVAIRFVEPLILTVKFVVVSANSIIGNYYDQVVTYCPTIGGPWTCDSNGDCAGIALHFTSLSF